MKTLSALAAFFVSSLSLPVFGQEIGSPGYSPGPDNYAIPPPITTYGTLSQIALGIARQGFSPLGDGEWSHFTNGMSYRSGGTNNTTCADVHLPTGASLLGISMYTNDTDAVGNIIATLYDFDYFHATSTTPWSVSTTGTPGAGGGRTDLTPGPLTVVQDQHALALCVQHTTTGSNLQSSGVVFWYRLQVSSAPAVATFTDVPVNHPFFRFVEALADSGITGGCGANPPRFCPDDPLTRGQMAAFLSIALGLHFPN
jgi:hypothetical protein